MTTLSGRCLCGTIRFTVPTPSRFEVCHCDDCRRWHGASAIGIDLTIVTLTSGETALRWFNSSPPVERGFCGTCGSSLFYRAKRDPRRWSVFHGALKDVPKRIPLGPQHFIGRRPSLYRIEVWSDQRAV